MDQLEKAVMDAAEGGAPAKTWQVPDTADTRFSTTAQGHPLDGLTITHWTD